MLPKLRAELGMVIEYACFSPKEVTKRVTKRDKNAIDEIAYMDTADALGLVIVYLEELADTIGDNPKQQCATRLYS